MATKSKLTTKIGVTKTAPKRFGQTEFETYPEMMRLSRDDPKALTVVLAIIINMGPSNALVTSQTTLATAAGVSLRTLQRALDRLKAENWIQIVQIGPTKTASAYVLNSRVAWFQKRDGLRYSLFDARVLASSAEQDDTRDTDTAPLRQLPKHSTTTVPSLHDLDLETPDEQDDAA